MTGIEVGGLTCVRIILVDHGESIFFREVSGEMIGINTDTFTTRVGYLMTKQDIQVMPLCNIYYVV